MKRVIKIGLVMLVAVSLSSCVIGVSDEHGSSVIFSEGEKPRLDLKPGTLLEALK